MGKGPEASTSTKYAQTSINLWDRESLVVDDENQKVYFDFHNQEMVAYALNLV